MKRFVGVIECDVCSRQREENIPEKWKDQNLFGFSPVIVKIGDWNKDNSYVTKEFPEVCGECREELINCYNDWLFERRESGEIQRSKTSGAQELATGKAAEVCKDFERGEEDAKIT